MPSQLKQSVLELVRDPAVAGIVVETEYQPLGGRNVAVAPPTYARQQGDNDRTPQHAVSENAFVPARNRDGWLVDIARDENCRPCTAARVIIDSVGSQSGRNEAGLWNSQDRLGARLPGISITVPDDVLSAERDPEIVSALRAEVSSWTAAHRHADAWARFAETDGGKQVWQQNGQIRELITTTSAATGEQLYRYFPNSAIFGFWLSSGVAARHKLPRSYSSEIIGYGAVPNVTGATKLDPTGGASEKSRVGFKNGELVVGKTGVEPSKAGFGQIPGQPMTTGYICELILQQASISLAVLRSISFENREIKDAALTVLTLLAMTGHELAAEDGFLRSHCSLLATVQRWGSMRQGQADPITLDVGGLDDLVGALQEAITDAESLGLRFAEPIRLNFSEAQRKLIAERVENERSKQTREN
ncbi:type I-U CRISPR-associated RAMP protein Csb1/Cas7u [Brevibacterium sp.]|uniref:type I-G CRISPR-associated RAMP protein Csb1/Cas7g n=1 Tax=Brevibacterium sp. TaxID=1701 RepID=UPI0028128675|nr:type I-U CRISPR-associated RAMP protein Csb1/Cas7u [Brevibacterium sp.]